MSHKHCGGKVVYQYGDAKHAVRLLHEQGYITARVYLCKVCCDGWCFHVTSGALGKLALRGNGPHRSETCATGGKP